MFFFSPLFPPLMFSSIISNLVSSSVLCRSDECVGISSRCSAGTASWSVCRPGLWASLKDTLVFLTSKELTGVRSVSAPGSPVWFCQLPPYRRPAAAALTPGQWCGKLENGTEYLYPVLIFIIIITIIFNYLKCITHICVNCKFLGIFFLLL